MSDIDNPATGKDVTLNLQVNGVLVKVQEVTRFTAELVNDTVETKGLGTTRRRIDKIPTGWRGELEISASRASVDEMVDLITAAKTVRVPVLVTVSETTVYRNLSSKTYVYPDIQIDFSKRKRRSEAVSVTLRWETGEQRIAA